MALMAVGHIEPAIPHLLSTFQAYSQLNPGTLPGPRTLYAIGPAQVGANGKARNSRRLNGSFERHSSTAGAWPKASNEKPKPR